MSSSKVTLTIEKEERIVTTIEELKQILTHICFQQLYPKFYGISYKKSPFKGSVYFNNKKIQFKLSEAMGEGEGIFKVYTEEPADYFKRNHVREQAETYCNYIIKSSDPANSITILLDDNLFSARIPKEIQGKSLSIFTDEEVLKISLKLSNPHIRFLCKNPAVNIGELHEIVMGYYKLY